MIIECEVYKLSGLLKMRQARDGNVCTIRKISLPVAAALMTMPWTNVWKMRPGIEGMKKGDKVGVKYIQTGRSGRTQKEETTARLTLELEDVGPMVVAFLQELRSGHFFSSQTDDPHLPTEPARKTEADKRRFRACAKRTAEFGTYLDFLVAREESDFEPTEK